MTSACAGRAAAWTVLAAAMAGAARAPAAAGTLSLSLTSRAPLDEPVLELAFLDDQLLVLLSAAQVALYGWTPAGFCRLAQSPLPGPRETVRAPGGLLRVSEPESAFWALTSGRPRAVLFALEGAILRQRDEAEALPFPGCRGGLRYRPGTHLIEGELAGLGEGPFLEVAPVEGGMAVAPDGRLLGSAAQAESHVRVGPTLAPLWPGLVAAASPSPPGPEDAIVVLAAQESGWQTVATWPVSGAVRALAARVRGPEAGLVAATQDPDGGTWLLAARVRREP